MDLRPYQQQGITDIRDAFRDHRRVVYVLPTGGGKTVTFSFIAKNASARGKRVLIEVHRRELIKQASRTFTRMGIPHGVIAPGHPLTNDLVQICSVQTLVNRLEVLPPPDIIVTDEGHHGVAETWKRIYDHWPLARVLLVTATPGRPDGQGLGSVADTMIIGPTMRWLIDNGYLADYDYYAPPSKVDLKGLRSRLGDFESKELEKRVNQSTITGDCIEHFKSLCPAERALAFCVSVQHAKDVAALFTAAGIKAASVDGGMLDADRDRVIEQFSNGEIQILTSCQLIGEGFDVPECGAVIDLAPTKSVINYLQRVGRALRPKADGRRAIILDHVGNVHRHMPPDAERAWTLNDKVKTKTDALSTCKQCFRIFYAKDRPTIACPNETAPECPYMKGEDEESIAARKKLPKQVNGRLEKINPLMGETRERPTWAPDLNLKADPINRILERASTKEHLQEIARVRGYNGFWVLKVFKAWAKGRRGRAA